MHRQSWTGEVVGGAGRWLIVGACLWALTACGSSDKEGEKSQAEMAKAAEELRAYEERQKKAEAGEEAAKAAPADEVQGWGLTMRKMGTVMKDRATSCRTLAMDRMSAPAAVKSLPIVKREELENACGWLVSRYESQNEADTGKHFTVDGLYVKLARFKDLYERLLVDYDNDAPGERMSATIAELQRLIERIERNAGAVSEFKIDAHPANQYEEKKVPGGKIRAVVEDIGRNDRSDMGTLPQKWKDWALEPSKKDERIYKASLEYIPRLRAAWQRNHRDRLNSLHSDKESYDRKVKAEAEAYLRRGDELVLAFIAAAKPYLEGKTPSSGEARELERALDKAHAAWEKANSELPERLSKLY